MTTQYQTLLHMTGPNGSTTFPDESGKTWTSTNGASLSVSQYKFSPSSGLFVKASGQYIYTPNHTDFSILGKSFVIDLWTWFVSLPVSAHMIFWAKYNDADNFQKFGIYENAGNYRLYYWVRSAASNIIYHDVAIPTLSINTWYHFELDRDAISNLYHLFLNGTEQGSSLSNSVSIPDISGNVRIGSTIASGDDLNGYIDEVRFWNGFYDHVSNFTPRTNPYDFVGISSCEVSNEVGVTI